VNVKVFEDFTFGAHAVEVSVDPETGEVDVLRIISSFDVGKAINMLSVEGQMDGGAVLGLGYALMEEILIEKGRIMTPSLTEYLIPTSSDVPDVETIVIESLDGVGPFGAKGIGEPACNSIAPAITNAIFDAVGARIMQLPATPEKIIKCLGKF
jgi:CO/xanthine dehydrogenase Mo-binding subunit